jgi:hypothetical protein
MELGELCTRIDGALAPAMEDVTPLTEYAARFRYPGAPWEPTVQEARESIELARTFIHSTSKGYHLALPSLTIVPKTQWNLEGRHICGPMGTRTRMAGSYMLQHAPGEGRGDDQAVPIVHAAWRGDTSEWILASHSSRAVSRSNWACMPIQ